MDYTQLCSKLLVRMRVHTLPTPDSINISCSVDAVLLERRALHCLSVGV